MLRIISSKLAQTSGDLSIPHSDQQVLKPYKDLARFVSREWKNRQQEKQKSQWSRNLNRYERARSPAHGKCPNCGDSKAIDERGRRFCPSPECNVPRPRYSAPKI